MKSTVFVISILFSLAFTLPNHIDLKTVKIKQKLDSCHYNDKKLYGKIQFVEYASDADLKVQIVNSFPDLKVKFVESFPDECGEWQIVESGADLRVFITESFPDIKIQVVSSFPGVSK